MNNLASLILRLSFGGLMIPHGISKLQKLFEQGFEVQFPDPVGIGPFVTIILVLIAELICSIFIILGYKVKIVIIPLIITMFVAAFVVHSGDSLSERELSLIYLSGYITIALIGTGKFSLEYYLKK